jgi:hypothetical protein
MQSQLWGGDSHNRKFVNAVLYFCQGGVVKTKLNKLLFYADFKHFKEHTVSITGTRYARIPFGPAPDDYDIYYGVFVRQGIIDVQEIQYGEKYVARQEPDMTLFSDSERETLRLIKEHFRGLRATEVSEISHQEKGYMETDTGHPIDYSYAQDLTI